MTFGSAPLLIWDLTRYRRKQLRCIPNLQRLTEEDSIFWFYMCGWKLTEDQDNDTGSSDKTKIPVVTRHRQDRNKIMTTAHNRAVCSDSPSQLMP